MVRFACAGIMVVMALSILSMDDNQRPLRAGLISCDVQTSNIYTPEALLKVLKPICHEKIESVTNTINSVKGNRLIDYTFQKPYYDARQAALAAHIILNTNIRLYPSDYVALDIDLRYLGLISMATVLVEASYYWEFQENMAVFTYADSLNPADKQAIMHHNAFRACRGFAALGVLKSAYALGQRFINLDTYQAETGADYVVEYITNKKLR